MELLVSMLDKSASEFFAKQVSNSEKLFREFDDMALTFSDVIIDIHHDAEVLIKTHLNIGASFAETGASIDLLDSSQMLSLRKTEDGWKICAME